MHIMHMHSLAAKGKSLSRTKARRVSINHLLHANITVAVRRRTQDPGRAGTRCGWGLGIPKMDRSTLHIHIHINSPTGKGAAFIPFEK